MVLTPLWEDREQLRPQPGMSLRDYFEVLQPRYIMRGRFYPGQILADIKFARPLAEASDWQTFAVSGPGSRRGMNYLLGRDPATVWDKGRWHEHLVALADAVRGPLQENGITRQSEDLDNQNLQNTLCEFSKYQAALQGKPPKRRYHPGSIERRSRCPARNTQQRTPPAGDEGRTVRVGRLLSRGRPSLIREVYSR